MPVSKSASIEFVETAERINEPVTKFGGQPVWIEESQWPLSKQTGNPMEFICQIELSENLFTGSKGKMAYIFMTEEEEYIDGTWEPDGGENAIIIQPGIPSVKVKEIQGGPSIKKYVKVEGYDRLQPQLKEYSVLLTVQEDPEYASEEIRSNWDDSKFDEYAQSLDGNKIGGTPIFLQGDEFPDGGGFKLLLQLDSTQIPFHVNFGDAGIAYAFINQDGTAGKFLWQCA